MTTDGGSPEDLPQVPERFEVLEELPAIGGAQVVRAYDTLLTREVFLKCPGPALREAYCDASLRERSLREARALANIENPAVDRLLDVLETPGGPLLVLEPTRGESLAARLEREGRLAADEVIELGVALANALEEVHEDGIVHRGIAAACIHLDQEGGVRLTGFHFAKSGAGGPSKSMSSLVLTMSTDVASGPAHPAPEQLTKREDDPRSDLFGLGWVLFESLTGEAPYDGRDPLAWTAPKDARELAPDAPLGLARTLALCLSLSPSGRPQDAKALRRALESARPPVEGAPPVAADASSDPALAVAAATPAAPTRGSERFWTVLACVAALALAWLVVDRNTGEAPAAGVMAADGGDARGGVARRKPSATGTLVPRYERSYALLIGIGDAYEGTGFDPLPNAESDIAAVERALERETGSPWDVTTLTGERATREAIIDAIPLLAKKVKANDRVLVFFAGHGKAHDRDETGAWMIPSDADRAKRSSWVPFDTMLHLFKEMPAKHIMVALDCCYGGRLTQSRSASDAAYAKRFLTRKAHVILTSGLSDEEVSDGVAGEHSPFATAFLEALAGTGPLTSTALANHIKEAFVKADVGHTPVFGHPEGTPPGGEFVFFRGGK
ncbi:MAG: caspase family protein [Planctomycetota bacterium]|nr:caspase family protein [Planctomycetota bacterium]